MVWKKKLFIFIIIGCILAIPWSQGRSTITWSENFESGTSEELTLVAYSYVSNEFVQNNTALPVVVSNALHMPNTRGWGTWSGGQRNSSIAYGTWSYDVVIKEGENHSACDVVFLTMNNLPWNVSGFSLNSHTLEGYFLGMKSGSPNDIWGNIKNHSILFGKYEAITHEEVHLVTAQLPENIVGSHNVRVTRDLDGKFEVFFDSAKIITYTDNTIKTSEICVFASWSGDSIFDNITVSDNAENPTTTTTTTTTDSTNFASLFVISLGILIMIQRKRT
ncbi:MAG: hypothetical protein ACXABI_12955 [Candidatus Hodarchaeales archaeon]|jgi:hypothetical protein